MDRYTKGFVVASVVYLFVAAALGTWMGFSDVPVWARFGHVHFNLLGFMAMMVYGVGYFILPRFNARALVWPSWVPVHFYLANVGLLGMVATSAGRPSGAFGLFAGMSVLSVAMFALNIAATMLSAGDEEEEGEDTPAAVPKAAPVEVEITPDMRVGEILTRWPQVVPVFVENGFASLGDPGHREQVKQLPITLEMACGRHGVDVGDMVKLLSKVATGSGNGTGETAPRPQPVATVAAGTVSRGQKITSKHIIGDVLKVYPETEKVFRKYYGAACFSCPGQSTETVKQSAMMHNADEKAVLAELNEAAGV